MPNSPKIIAVANQKGGVGKTTTTLNLAAGLSQKGKSCLILDIDPQGNASTGLGIDYDSRPVTMYDVLADGVSIADGVQKTDDPNIDILPSTTDLSSIDVQLVADNQRVIRLRGLLSSADLSKYAYILIDCPPSLNLLTVNALAASESILVPLQSEFFALEGLSQLLLTVREVREAVNPALYIEGILLTMFDTRNRLSHQVEEDVRTNMKDLVYTTVIPRNVRVSEAPSFGQPVMVYDPKSAGSLAYAQMTQEFLERQKG